MNKSRTQIVQFRKYSRDDATACRRIQSRICSQAFKIQQIRAK